MAKSWLEVQVDLEFANVQPGSLDQFRNSGDIIDGSPGSSDHASQRSNRPENWPLQVLNQQPRQLPDLLQKLHSGYAMDYFSRKVYFFAPSSRSSLLT